MPVRILLADDHHIFRQGLRSLLKDYPDMQVVGEASDGPSTLRSIEECNPNVVVIDVNMPGLNGIDATRRILADHPNVRIIGLSMYTDERSVSEMFRAGATGYLPKNSDSDELVSAIRAVMAGKTYVSPSVSRDLVEIYVRGTSRGEPGAFSQLSAREREVLQLLSEGVSAREIASRLSVSVKTIHVHRDNIRKKLGISTDADLVKYAIREGLTGL